jgi:hypothetical protein
MRRPSRALATVIGGSLCPGSHAARSPARHHAGGPGRCTGGDRALYYSYQLGATRSSRMPCRERCSTGRSGPTSNSRQRFASAGGRRSRPGCCRRSWSDRQSHARFPNRLEQILRALGEDSILDPGVLRSAGARRTALRASSSARRVRSTAPNDPGVGHGARGRELIPALRATVAVEETPPGRAWMSGSAGSGGGRVHLPVPPTTPDADRDLGRAGRPRCRGPEP